VSGSTIDMSTRQLFHELHRHSIIPYFPVHRVVVFNMGEEIDHFDYALAVGAPAFLQGHRGYPSLDERAGISSAAEVTQTLGTIKKSLATVVDLS
jgi:hypothetical protein